MRFGYELPIVELNDEQIPKTLRDGLWDVTKACFFFEIANYPEYSEATFTDSFRYLTDIIWFSLYRESRDDISDDPEQALLQIKNKFYEFDFIGIYSFLEFMATYSTSQLVRNTSASNYTDFCNRVLEREKSAFRFADLTLVKITSEQELTEIKSAMKDSPSNSVSTHIKRAAELYGQRPSSDYRNSIKESISAVEAAVRYVTGEKTMGVAKPLRKVVDEIRLHPALRDGFEKLYAFTSDESGIRHALLDESSITQADARYMLVSCSAFANYLISFRHN